MKKLTILALHLNYGGIERCISSLSNMLVTDYEVEIVCSYKLLENPAFYIDPKVKIIYLLDVKPNKNEFRTALKNHKYVTAFKEGIKSLKILKARKKSMIDYIKKCNSDIIISTREIFNEYLGNYGSDNCLKIGWEHNHYHDNMKYADKVIRSAYKLDYFVLVSKSLEAFYRGKLRNSSCETVFIPNVIENVPKEDEISPLLEKRLVSVGRLSSEKGYLDLLKIFNIIVHDYPDWKLDIIGDGEEKEKLVKYVKYNNLENSVTFHGYKNKEYIYNTFYKSSIYLMTSYTESFGIVLLEAMSMGLPCIAFSSAEGANEIINSGSNGYLIKNRNFSAYIKKVEDLIEDNESRKKVGLEGRRTIKKYTKDVVKKEWLNILEKK